MTLVTRRTLLLPYSNEFRNEFIMLNCCPKNRAQMNGPHTVASAKALFDSMLTDESTYAAAVVLSRTNEYIGHLFISELDTAPELGFIFDKSVWGQGLATEALQAFFPKALQHLGLKQVKASVNIGHTASLKLLAKLGFEVLGQNQDEFGPYYELQFCTDSAATYDEVEERSSLV
ncbi:GNAT family N-acetyltransferase [Vibrio astriarenae]|uniref:GNAT family N-acetyltransferase n=1 Tax=Vibrio astriarenae TaxID=1481923 RepID=UPI0037350E35